MFAPEATAEAQIPRATPALLRWCALGLAALVCLALYFIWAHLPYYRRERTGDVRIDWTGAVLVALVLGGFQTFIEAVPKDGLTTSNLILAALVALGAAALLVCERRATHPIVPLDLFRDPQLVTLFTLSVLSGFVMFSLIFFAPLLLQGGFGLSPQQAGLLATPIAACIALGSLINTRIVIHMPRPTAILSIGFSLLVAASVSSTCSSRSTRRSSARHCRRSSSNYTASSTTRGSRARICSRPWSQCPCSGVWATISAVNTS